MRKLLLSGASVALLSLGAVALPTLADSPSTTADPVGLTQVADSSITGASDTVQPAASDAVTSPAPATGEAEILTPLPEDNSVAEQGATPDDATTDEAAPTGQLVAEAVQPAETVMIDEVLGADVVDINGEDVASVEDVLVAPDGTLTHVVISYGGFFGIGSKEVLVPWESVSYNAAQDIVQIPGNEADLEAAPAFVTQEELLDQQEADRLAQQPSPTGVTVPQQAQTPNPE